MDTKIHSTHAYMLLLMSQLSSLAHKLLMLMLMLASLVRTGLNSGEAWKEWLHWKRTFDNFLAVLPQRDLDKRSVLANYVSPSIFQHIEDCTDYGAAVGILQALFVKPRNENLCPPYPCQEVPTTSRNAG